MSRPLRLVLYGLAILLCLFGLGLCLLGIKLGIELMAMELGYSTPNWVTYALTAIGGVLVLLWGYRDHRRNVPPTNPN